jgi:hypothetical protein
MIMAKWPFTNSPFCPESLLGKRTRTNCLSKLTQDLFSGRAIGTGIITRYLKQIFYLAERTIKNGKNNYKQFILLNNSRPYWITYILTSNLKSRIIQNTWPSWISTYILRWPLHTFNLGRHWPRCTTYVPIIIQRIFCSRQNHCTHQTHVSCFFLNSFM